MRRVWKATKLVSLSLFGLILVLVGGGLAYRAWYQHKAGEALVIYAPNGIDEAMFVPIDGNQQWITIRGRDRNNPVVLMLHGGPGVTNGGYSVSFLPWEKDFTIVQWDQPGAGRTFARAGRRFPPGLTIESMAEDGIAVAEFLKTHLHQERIILLGWSWGSILGIHMAQARPDLFVAYVGTGQIVNMQAGEAIVYARVLAIARAKNNRRAIRELESIGPPPYQTQAELGTQRKWAITFEGRNPLVELPELALFAPRTSLVDGWSFISGVIASQNHFIGPRMEGEMMNVDLAAENTDFAVPVFIIQGTEDNVIPAELARAYVEKLTAPQKAYIPIEGAGHIALVNKTDKFLKAITERVRPLAIPPAPIARSARPQIGAAVRERPHVE